MEQITFSTAGFKDGDPIIKEDTSSIRAYNAYIVKTGKVKVWKNIDGKAVLVRILNEGDVFGEMAFLGSTKRTASVTAAGEVELLVIPGETFIEAIDQLPHDIQTKLSTVVRILSNVTEVFSYLKVHVKDLKNIKADGIDVETFENAIKQLPEVMRQVVYAIFQRLDADIKECSQLIVLLEKVAKDFETLSLKETSKSS